MMNSKPALGLRPEWVVNELRFREILEAMDRYLANDQIIPDDWVDELNRVISKYNKNILKTQETKFKHSLHPPFACYALIRSDTYW